jgi:hypothetical protein
MENQEFNSDFKKISIAGSKLIAIYNWVVFLVILNIVEFFLAKYYIDLTEQISGRDYSEIDNDIMPTLLNTVFPIIEFIIYSFILSNLFSAGKNLKYAFTIPHKNGQIPLSDAEYYRDLSKKKYDESLIIEITNTCPSCKKEINDADKECPSCGLSLTN